MNSILLVLLCIFLMGVAIAGLLSKRTPRWFQARTNISRFAWLSGLWAAFCWFGTGGLVFMWPLLAVLSACFAAYAMYVFEGNPLRRSVLALGAPLPGSVTYWLLSPTWPHGWASFKPVFVGGPLIVILVVVLLWLVLQHLFIMKQRSASRPTNRSP